MLRILHDTKIDFIRHWRTAVILTVAFVIVGFASSFVNGWFTSSIEFTGGTLMRLKFKAAPDVAAIRSALDGAGVRGVEVQQYGDATTYTVRAQEAEQVAEQEAGATGVSKKIEEALRSALGADSFIVEDRMAVGPRVGAELARGAVIAVLFSFFVTLVYLAFRFDRNFGIAAVIATAHDILATIAFMKLMDLEISLTVIAAVLTVIGYSLNDTIIIFDRVRENLRKGKKEPLYDTLNRSVNETLPRSVLTHGTTIAATMALLFLAGDIIRPFAWVMTFGIFTGTFSSIFVASPILMWIEGKYPRLAPGTTAKAVTPARA